MARLVITNGVDTARFNPQRQYFDIYDHLKDNFGWDHDAADEVASWAEMAAPGSTFVTDEPELEIYIEE